MKIYLAGELYKNDWRDDLIGDGWSDFPKDIVFSVVDVHEYCGPFSRDDTSDKENRMPMITGSRLKEINQADIVYAWLYNFNDLRAQYELAYAAALKKTIYVGIDLYTVTYSYFETMLESICVHENIVDIVANGSPKKGLLFFLERDGFEIPNLYGGYATYQAYLNSAHWKSVRVATLERYEGKCALNINHDDAIHIHHRTYERLGEELPEDVIPLCASCHAKFHDKENCNEMS